jgi:hypothetical protein
MLADFTRSGSVLAKVGLELSDEIFGHVDVAGCNVNPLLTAALVYRPRHLARSVGVHLLTALLAYEIVFRPRRRLALSPAGASAQPGTMRAQ